MTNSVLKITDLRLWIHLGCTSEERQFPTMISIDLEYIFDEIPAGVYTDKLQDAVCYATVARKISSELKDKQFNLIEHVAYVTHKIASVNKSDFSYKLSVTVRKLRTPVEGICGDVSFKYCG